MTTDNPRNAREAYEALDTVATRREAQTITDAEFYRRSNELQCWAAEFELAERIAYAHPLNPAGAYERLVARHQPRRVIIAGFPLLCDNLAHAERMVKEYRGAYILEAIS